MPGRSEGELTWWREGRPRSSIRLHRAPSGGTPVSAPGSRSFAEIRKIGQIPGPAGSALVLDQPVASDDRHLQLADRDGDPRRPRVRKRDPGDAGEQVDPGGRHSDLEDEIGAGQFGGLQIVKRRSEPAQGPRRPVWRFRL